MAHMLKKPKNPVSDIDFSDKTLFEDLERLKKGLLAIQKEGQFTDDLPKLYEQSHQYLFTYGTLKYGFLRHDLLKGSPLVGYGYTESDRYFMANHRKHCYPIAFFENKEQVRARLYGELYKVPSSVFRELDNIESNGILYKRYPLKIRFIGKDLHDIRVISAWGYIGQRSYWLTRQKELQLARKFYPNKNKDNPYYCFTKQDEL